MTNFRHAHILGLMAIAVAAYGASAGNELQQALIMAALLAAAAVATILYERRAALKTPRAAAAPAAAKGGFVQTKRMLMLMMAIGIVVYGGGAGTFSSFSAETSNTNSSVASGTLTMTDAVNDSTSTACASMSSITQDNVNELPSGQNLNTGAGNATTPTSGSGSLGACDVALSLQNVAPGVFGGYAKIAIQNTGSLDASKFWLFAPYVNTALNPTDGTTISKNSALSPLPVLPTEGPIKANDTLELDYDGYSQTVTAAQDYPPLSTSIALKNSPTASIDFPTGTRVLDKSTDGKDINNNPQSTDCFDIRNGSAPTSAPLATTGQQLNFNHDNAKVSSENAATHWVTDAVSTYTGPLCDTLGFWIQEQSVVNGQTFNYCWYGDGATGSAHVPVTPNGMCRAPISANFPGSSTQNIDGATTYTITTPSPLRGNVAAGDQVWVTQVGHPTAYCSETQDAYIGSSQLVFNTCKDAASNGSAIPASQALYTYDEGASGATIIDGTTLNDLSGDLQTLSNFDTLLGPNNKQELATLVGNGKLANTGATVTSIELGHRGSAGSFNATSGVGSAPDSRTFYIGVFFPSGSSSAQNPLQGLKSTFGIGWHIDQ